MQIDFVKRDERIPKYKANRAKAKIMINEVFIQLHLPYYLDQIDK